MAGEFGGKPYTLNRCILGCIAESHHESELGGRAGPRSAKGYGWGERGRHPDQVPKTLEFRSGSGSPCVPGGAGLESPPRNAEGGDAG